jgi:hypothetical protein
LTSDQPSIRQVRSDKKLGVEFDSPETLARYLVFVEENAEEDPGIRHFIPVLKNGGKRKGGIVPQDADMYDADITFGKLLIDMGIMRWDIPNGIWGHFLSAFLQSSSATKSTASSGPEQ